MQMQRLFTNRALCTSSARRMTTELEKAHRTLSRFEEKVKHGKKCHGCWLPPHACICKSLQSIQTRALHCDVTIAIHHREYGKTANTAKLVRAVLPGSKLLVGVSERAALEAAIACTGTHAVLLWPGEGSMPARDYRRRESIDGRINLLALDGTWRQVKSMARRYATLPRIHVSDELREQRSKAHLRKEIREHGACTAEAIALALKALGEPQCVEPIYQAIDELNELVVTSHELGLSGHPSSTRAQTLTRMATHDSSRRR